jgi:HD superfamily phosphohydrolase
LLNTIQVIDMEPRRGEADPIAPRIGVSEGGIHAVEGMILARYYMFTQVYFHKTRVAYDFHLQNALKALLPGGTFPLPSAEQIEEYLKWDDWRVLGLLADPSNGGDHSDRIRQRNHYRQVWCTPESPGEGDRTTLTAIRNNLGDLVAATVRSETSTYKLQTADISVESENEPRRSRSLSDHSSIVLNLNQHPIKLVRLYSKPEDAPTARARIAELLQESQ